MAKQEEKGSETLKKDIADLEAKKAALLAETEDIEARQAVVAGKKLSKAQTKKLAEERKAMLRTRINSSTDYPKETVTKMRMELKAIAEGRWFPGYKPPKIPTKYDKFMDGYDGT